MRGANRRASSCVLKAEGEAYANAMLRDVALEVDGEPQPLTLVDSRFPRPLDMEAGMDTIHLRVAAEASAGALGDHTLSYCNDKQPVNSRYWTTPSRRPARSRSRSKPMMNLKRHRSELHCRARPGGIRHRQHERVRDGRRSVWRRLGTAVTVDRYLYESTFSPWLLVVGLGLSALLGAHSRLDRFTSLRSRLGDEDDGRERKARRREVVDESSSEAPEGPVYEP